MQETCLLVQVTALRAASLYFHENVSLMTNAFLFDSHGNSRLDNDVSGHSPKYLHSSRRLIMQHFLHGSR